MINLDDVFATENVDDQSLLDTFINCVKCSKPNMVVVSSEGLGNYFANGVKAQDAFPELNPAERELFISGVCGTCWDQMFSFNEGE